MHLLSVRLAALLSLAAVRLDKARIPLWGYRFALWKLRTEHPDALREFPPIAPMHPDYWLWTFPPIAMSMGIIGGRVRFAESTQTLELSSIDAKSALVRLSSLGWDDEIDAMRPLVAPFIAWSQPIRKEDAVPRSKAETYADILVAVFSLAAINHGHLSTPISEFHRLLVALRKEFPDDMPAFDEVGRAPFQSSEILSDALCRALNGDPARMLTDERLNLVVDRARAMRNMNAFDDFTRARLVRAYSKVAERLVAILRARDDGPTPLTSA